MEFLHEPLAFLLPPTLAPWFAVVHGMLLAIAAILWRFAGERRRRWLLRTALPAFVSLAIFAAFYALHQYNEYFAYYGAYAGQINYESPEQWAAARYQNFVPFYMAAGLSGALSTWLLLNITRSGRAREPQQPAPRAEHSLPSSP